MGILALVLYVLGMVLMHGVLVEEQPKSTKFDLIFVSVLWPLIVVVAVIRGLYVRLSE